VSKIISFVWTTPALLAGRKTCTRRFWNPAYAARFEAEERVQAWNRSPRTGQGRQVAWIRLTAKPYWEALSKMPDSDYEAEGFAFFAEHPERLTPAYGPMWTSWASFDAWRASGEYMWVVRFNLEDVLAEARQIT